LTSGGDDGTVVVAVAENDGLERIEKRVDAIADDVRGLRVLHEHHDALIQTIAEVQAHHGQQLEEHGRLLREIRDELAPLRDLRDFVKRVADNHERRITALEERTGR
jgi:hypothetical protein